METQLTYWQDRLGGELPVLELPWDRPRPAVPTYQGAQQPLTLSPELSAALKTLSARSNVTLFTLLLTAFKVLLHRYSQQVDIVVGSDIANRDRLETEGLIGLLVNTLVLRSDLSGNPRFCDLLAQVRETVLGALAHQDLPFERAGGSAQPRSPPEPDDAPVSGQAGFATGPSATPGAGRHPTLERYPLADQSAKYELRFKPAGCRAGHFRPGGSYSIDLFDASTIARLVEHFQVHADGALSPTRPAAWLRLPLISDAVNATPLLNTWNQTQSPFPDDHLASTNCFEAQAQRTPPMPLP